ncbi:MAG: hypothetical protein KKC55_16215 [Gammaproteobacteria bacterium]|nr:hypothetical protein [Gammaproteobacteria bacterium]
MITNRFMHIGLPHTGGGSLHSFFTQWDGIQVIDRKAHQSYDWMAARAVEEGFAVPPAFVFVRNPWSWRVAMWTWVYAEYRNRSWFGETDGTFDDYMRVCESHRVTGQYDNGFSGIAWSWKELQGDKAQWTGKLESFENDCVRIFLSLLPDLTNREEIRACVQRAGRANRRQDPFTGTWHGPYQEYYTDRWRDLVAEWDAPIIERFGYSFE